MIGTLSKINSESLNVKTFKIKTESVFNFVAGQFITIIHKKEDKVIRRSYSISSYNKNKTEFEICVKLVKNGEFTNILFKKKENEKIEFIGPYGFFNLKENEKNLVFICVGTGIAPIKSMLIYLEKIKSNKKITLICGYKDEKSILYFNYFENLKQKLNMEIFYCLSQEKHERHFNGRILKFLETSNMDFNNKDFYICGIREMVEDTITFLKEKNLLKSSIVAERF